MPGLPWADITERSAHGKFGGTHSPQGRQRWQSVRSVPYAEARNPGCPRRICEFTHLQIHLAGDDRQIQDSQPLHVLPYRQVYRLGNEGTDDMENDISVASRTMRSL